MGYIELSTPVPAKDKATNRMILSLWFRVPGTTITKVKEEYQNWFGTSPRPDRRRFLGIVPLLTFGPRNLRAKPVFYAGKVTGTWPGVYDYHWTDGFGFPECEGAEWTITDHGGLPAGSDYYQPYYTFDDDGVGAGGDGPPALAAGDFNFDGSYIGVDCTGSKPHLSVSIVMPANDEPDEANAIGEPTSNTWSGEIRNFSGTGSCPGAPPGQEVMPPGDPMEGSICYIDTFYDLQSVATQEGTVDALMTCVPEMFRNLPADLAGASITDNGGDQVYTGPEITRDHWHHLLLSFDLRNAVKTEGQLVEVTVDAGVPSSTPATDNTEADRTTSTCKMWMAIDDVNLTGSALSVYCPRGGDDKTLNDILSVNGFYTASSVNRSVHEINNPATACNGTNYTADAVSFVPSYDYTPGNLEVGTIALPAHSAYVDAIRHCELGDLQIFTNICYDDIGPPKPDEVASSKEERFRRAFITEKGKPANPGKAAKLLGKKPEVIMNKAGYWKKARNVGTLAVPPPVGPEDGNYLGDIQAYRPKPNLRDEQGPPQ